MPATQHPVICRRTLRVVFPDGNASKFEIQVSAPFETSNEDFCCEVCSDDVLFAGMQKVFGIDGIDALDYAIQFIDLAVANFERGALQWPDGTPYKRVPSSRKLQWG